MMHNWHEDDVEQLTPEEVRAYCAAAPEYVGELDRLGYTPLLTACIKGATEVARALLEAGADPNFTAGDGETPLKATIPHCGERFNRALFDLRGVHLDGRDRNGRAGGRDGKRDGQCGL